MAERQSLPDDHEFLWAADGIRRSDPPPASQAPQAPAPHDAQAAPLSPRDHRRFPRIDLKLPILYKILNEESSTVSETVRPYVKTQSDNISSSGACLMLAEPLRAGTIVALSIHLENRQKISAVARVVWSETSDVPHHFLTGLEFVSVYKKATTQTEYLSPDDFQSLLG